MRGVTAMPERTRIPGWLRLDLAVLVICLILIGIGFGIGVLW